MKIWDKFFQSFFGVLFTFLFFAATTLAQVGSDPKNTYQGCSFSDLLSSKDSRALNFQENPLTSNLIPSKIRYNPYSGKTVTTPLPSQNNSNAVPTELLPYQAMGYRFIVIGQNDPLPPGYEQPNYNDSNWGLGQAAFGFARGYCSIQAMVRTLWPESTRLLLRRPIMIPENSQNVRIKIAVDNRVENLFFNGVPIQNQPIQNIDCPLLDEHEIAVPQELVRPGNNLIVYQVYDIGFETFFDSRVIADVSSTPINQPPTAGFTMSHGPQSAIDGQTLNVSALSTPVPVNFVANRSGDSDGSIVAWNWKIDGQTVSNLSSFPYGLNFGNHTVSLFVTDNKGAVSQIVSGQILVQRPVACTSTDSSPATNLTRLIADGNDPTLLGSRIPLILIHGVHGNKPFGGADNINDPYRGNFNLFLSYFYSNGLNLKYKIYRFHYVSDQIPVSEISRGLRNHIDSEMCRDASFDKQFVMIAHSMGGLVARSYMNVWRHNVGANILGGERVLKLITLATPHHGSPGTNSMSRDERATLGWENIMDIGSLLYWKGLNETTIVPRLPYNLPNRSDLLWDNFDNVFNAGNPDINNWLRTLNENEKYSPKIIAYYGFIPLDDPKRMALVKQYNAEGFHITKPLRPDKIIGDAIFAGLHNDEHSLSLISNIVLDYGLKRLFSLNDGLVPNESGSFRLAAVEKRVACPGYDHADMRDGKRSDRCQNNLTLFESVKQDLNNIQINNLRAP